MAPAIRPARSESAPSVALIDSACDLSNVSGRAPYLRMLARSSASDWVKLPLICAGPGIRSWICGADWTTPSRTIATCLPVVSSVRRVNLAWPLLVKSTLTVH
jgi:hypothetical protein